MLRPSKQGQPQKEQQQVVLLSANGGPQQRILVSPGWRIEDDLQRISLTKRFIEQSPKQQLKPDTALDIERQLRQHFAVINNQIQLNRDLLLSRGEISTQTPYGGNDKGRESKREYSDTSRSPVIVPQTTVIVNPSALESVEKMMAESLLNAPLTSGQVNLANSASPTSLIRNSSGEIPEQQLARSPQRTGTSQETPNSRFPGSKHKSVAEERRETNFSEPSTKIKDESQTQKRASALDREEKTTLHDREHSDKTQTMCDPNPTRSGKIESAMSHKKQRQSVTRSVYGAKQQKTRRASQDSETESESSLQQVGAMIIVQPNSATQREGRKVSPERWNSPRRTDRDRSKLLIVDDNSTVIHVTANDATSYLHSAGGHGSAGSTSRSPKHTSQNVHRDNSAMRSSFQAQFIQGTTMNPPPGFPIQPPTINVALQPGNHTPPTDLRIHSAGFPEQKRLPGKAEHRLKYKEFQAKVQEREEEFKSHNELDFKFMQNSPYNFQDILERLHSQEKARTRKRGEKFANRACDLHRDQLMSPETPNYTQLVMSNGNVTMQANTPPANNEASVKDINIKVNDKEIDLPTDGSMSKEKEGFAFKSSVTSIPYHYARSSGLSSHGVKQAAASLSSVLQTRPIKNNFSSSVNNKLSSGQNKKRINQDGTVMLTPDKHQTTELFKGSETLQEQINEIKVQAGNSDQDMQDNQNTLQQVSMDVSYRKGDAGPSSVDSGMINIKLEGGKGNVSNYPSSNNVTTINTHGHPPHPPPSPDSKAPQRKSVLSHLAASRDSVRQKETKSPGNPPHRQHLRGDHREASMPHNHVIVGGSDTSQKDKGHPSFQKKRSSNHPHAHLEQQHAVNNQQRVHHQTTVQIKNQQQIAISKQNTAELPVMDSFQDQRRTSNDSVNTNNVVTEGNSVFNQKQLIEKSIDGAPTSNIQEFDMQSNRFTEKEIQPVIDDEVGMGDTDRISPTQNSSVAGFGLSCNRLKFKDCGMISNVIIKQKKVPHHPSPKKSPIRKSDHFNEDSIFFSKPQVASGDNFLRGQSILWTGAGEQSSRELSLQRNQAKKSPKNSSFVVVPQVWRRDQHHSQQQQPDLDLTVKRTFIVPLNLQHQNSLYFMRDKRGEVQGLNSSYNTSRPGMQKGQSKIFQLKSNSTATQPSFNATTPQFNTQGIKFSSPSALHLLEMQKTTEKTPKNMTAQRRRSSTLRQEKMAAHHTPSYFFQSNVTPAENFEQQATAFLKNSQQKIASLHHGRGDATIPASFQGQTRESPSNAMGTTPTKKTPKTSYQSLRGEAYYYHVASPFPQGTKNATNRLALRTQDGTQSKDNILGVVLSTPNGSLPTASIGQPQTPKEMQLNSEGNPAFQMTRDALKQQRAAAIRRQQIQNAVTQQQQQLHQQHQTKQQPHKRVKRELTGKPSNHDIIPLIVQPNTANNSINYQNSGSNQNKDDHSKHTTESKASQIDFPSQTSQPLLDEEEEQDDRYVESLNTQKSPFQQPFSDTGAYSLQRNVETEFSRDLMMIQTPTIHGHEEHLDESSPLNLTQTSQNHFVKTASYADKRNKNLRKWEGRQNQLVRRIERAFGAIHVKRSPGLRTTNVYPKLGQGDQFTVGNLNEDSVDSHKHARSVPRSRQMGTFSTQKRSKWQNLIDNIAMDTGLVKDGDKQRINCNSRVQGKQHINYQRRESLGGKPKDQSEISCISDHEASITAQFSDTSKQVAARKSPGKELRNATSWLLPDLLHSELDKNSQRKNSLATKLSPFMFDNKQYDLRQISPANQANKVNFLTGAKVFKK